MTEEVVITERLIVLLEDLFVNLSDTADHGCLTLTGHYFKPG